MGFILILIKGSRSHFLRIIRIALIIAKGSLMSIKGISRISWIVIDLMEEAAIGKTRTCKTINNKTNKIKTFITLIGEISSRIKRLIKDTNSRAMAKNQVLMDLQVGSGLNKTTSKNIRAINFD